MPEPRGNADRMLWRGGALLLVVLLLLHRALVLAAVGIRYVDDDQALLWYVARDVAAGHVREPSFPAQAYGTAIESWLGAPACWLGVPLHIALPIITTLLALAPFLLLARLAWRRGEQGAALSILVLPLLLPTSYAVISGIPHGYGAPGNCVAAIGAVLLFSERRVAVAVGSFLEMVALTMNETSALLDGFRHMDRFFSPFMPLGAPAWLFPVVGAVLIAVFLRNGQRLAAVVCLACFAPALLSLGMPKIHQGSASVFFSWARAYLALPLSIAFLLVIGARRPIPRWMLLGLVLAATVNVGVQLSRLDEEADALVSLDAGDVFFYPVATVERDCAELERVAQASGAGLVVFRAGRSYAYACGALGYGHLDTLYPRYERRTWRLVEEAARTRDRMLLFGADGATCRDFLVKGATQCALVSDALKTAMVTFPPQSAVQFLRSVGGEVRPF